MGVRELQPQLNELRDAAVHNVLAQGPFPDYRPGPKGRPPVYRSITAEELLTDENIVMPSLRIEGFLPERGVVLLGGRPKCGKTWFAVQTALAVVTGNPLGGYLEVHSPGRCHLWALEDRAPITKDKLHKLLQGAIPDGIRDLQVFDELQYPILRGGDAILRQALKDLPAEVIILDSLFKLTGQTSARDSITQADYDVIDRVRAVALEHGAVAIVCMHTKKGARPGAPIENLMGTTGITAAADAIVEISRMGRNGKLTITGRVVPEAEFDLEFAEGPSWGWTIQGKVGENALGETESDVLAYLEAQGPTKPSTIAAGIHKTFAAAWCAINRLQKKGKVIKQPDRRVRLAE